MNFLLGKFMRNIYRALLAVTLTTIHYQAHAGWFDNIGFYEEECINLFKQRHNINYHVIAENVVKRGSDKYEFTPVMVVRGEKSPLTRQFCEYYPDEKMIYIGTAQSVLDARHEEQKEELKKKLIEDGKRAEQKRRADREAAELRKIRQQFEMEQAEKDRQEAERLAKEEAELRIKRRQFEMEQAEKDRKAAEKKRLEMLNEKEKQKKLAIEREKQRKLETLQIGSECLRKHGINDKIIYVAITKHGQVLVNYNDWKPKAICDYPKFPPKKTYRVNP
jgi:hypothetical protein